MSSLMGDTEVAEGEVGVSMTAFFFFRLRRFFFGLDGTDLSASSSEPLPSDNAWRFSKGFFSRSEGSLEGEGSSLGRIRDAEVSLMPVSEACDRSRG